MQQLNSKKFRALLLALGTIVGTAQAGEPWYVTAMTGAVAAAYILAQGLADQGKEATKLAIEKGEKAAEDALKSAGE